MLLFYRNTYTYIIKFYPTSHIKYSQFVVKGSRGFDLPGTSRMACTIDSGARGQHNSARSGHVSNDHKSMESIDDVNVSKEEVWIGLEHCTCAIG